jgi:hypothetical protein
VPAANEAARVVEALQPGMMGPRLSGLLGCADQACHVLDAKYEPGLKGVFLYHWDTDSSAAIWSTVPETERSRRWRHRACGYQSSRTTLICRPCHG